MSVAKRNTKGQFQKGSKHLVKHGMYGSRFYFIFANLKQRCRDKNHKSFKDYGARGIKVGWSSFDEFKNDMYDTYKSHYLLHGDDTTIDRIDNNQDYCKHNCRWATKAEQSKNRRNIRYLSLNGDTLSMADWSRRLNIDIRYISNWTKRGKTLEEIVLKIKPKAREYVKSLSK